MPDFSRLIGIVAAASGLMLLAGVAQAKETDAAPAIGGSLAVGAMHFQFEEFDADDRRLVEESGWLPGVTAALGWHGSRFSLGGALAYYSGEIDYDGQTSLGVPIDSDTEQHILDLALETAYRLPLALPPRVYVYAGGAYRHWQRDIQSVGAVSGLDETYQWWRAEAGARLRWSAGANEWGLDGAVTRNLNPDVEVDFGGAFDSVTLDLGERWGWRTGANWSRRVAPGLAVGLDVFYERWDLGESSTETLGSNGVSAGSVFQPRSESRNYGIALTLRRAW